jgi:hypothetical protein
LAVPKSVSLAHAAAARGQIAAPRAGNTELAQAYGFVKDQIEAAVLDAAVQTNAETQARFAAEEARLGRTLSENEKFHIHRAAGRDTRDRKVHDDLTADERNQIWEDRLATETGHSMTTLAADLLHQAQAHLPEHLRPAAQAATRHLGPSPYEAQFAAAAGRDQTAHGSGEGGRVAGVTGGAVEWSRQEVLAKAIAGCAQRSATRCGHCAAARVRVAGYPGGDAWRVDAGMGDAVQRAHDFRPRRAELLPRDEGRPSTPRPAAPTGVGSFGAGQRRTYFVPPFPTLIVTWWATLL